MKAPGICRLTALAACLACAAGTRAVPPEEPADGGQDAPMDGTANAREAPPKRLDVAAPAFDGRGPSRDLRPADQFVLPASGVMAFPGAEGFGADTPGGRAGKILEVTSLSDTGPGSFREAARATGPRIVVFRVSGTITLGSDIEISGDTRSHLTVAGQTSPGGVQLRGPSNGINLMNGVHDVVIRHLRIRPGATSDGSLGNACVMLSNGASNVVVDHVSCSWQNHKQMLTYHAATRATFQWNIIAEGSGSGPNTDVGAGFVVGHYEENDQISFHHNLVAHLAFAVNAYRVQTFDIRNNVIYDYQGSGPGRLGEAGAAVANVVGNHLIAGPNSAPALFFELYNGASGTRIFTEGNWSALCPTGCPNDWANGFPDGDRPAASSGEAKYRSATPFPAPPVATLRTGDVRDTVLFYAGANRPRDSLDARLVDDVLERRGGLAPDKAGRGPWPVLAGPEPPSDRDHDGMPNAWESAHGLDPDDPADGPMVAKNRYTNVENYLDELAGDPVP